MAHRKDQHCLRRSMQKFRQNLCTQATQYLFANHLFNLQHAFHIYNNQLGNETIDNLLLGKDSDTWWKSGENGLRKLTNGIDNQVR